jgi:hypothetical protein
MRLTFAPVEIILQLLPSFTVIFDRKQRRPFGKQPRSCQPRKPSLAVSGFGGDDQRRLLSIRLRTPGLCGGPGRRGFGECGIKGIESETPFCATIGMCCGLRQPALPRPRTASCPQLAAIPPTAQYNYGPFLLCCFVCIPVNLCVPPFPVKLPLFQAAATP